MLFAKIYIFILFFLHNLLGIKFYGLGIIQNIIISDYVLSFKNKKIFYNHKIKGSYDLLIIGKSNEPETHLFINFVIPKLNNCSFVDIGASVGEMVIGVSVFDNIEKIYAFELRRECAEVIMRSCEMNQEKRVKVYQKALGNKKGTIEFCDDRSGSGSGVYERDLDLNVKKSEVDPMYLHLMRRYRD
ncbi:MAG: FkbM family methyltransferase [Chlorobium sp.]|nr:MAG: FkbM family methyltransferase [Chlorobium sp.]